MRSSQKYSQISVSPLSPKPYKQIWPLYVHIHSLTAWNITGGHADDRQKKNGMKHKAETCDLLIMSWLKQNIC
jgi:hypothetical protein